MNMTGDYLMAFVSVQKVGKLRGRDKCGEEHFLNIYFSYTKTQDKKLV